jgi:chorismate mutase
LLGTVAGSLGMEHKPVAGMISSLNHEKDAHVRQVVMQAHEELLQLLKQRADLMKRIGTLKQTISGLGNLFGASVLDDELLELVGEPKDKKRQTGFTNTCRKILIDAKCPLTAREVCQIMQEKMPILLARHREPLASVTTVLNRLAGYGEAEPVMCNGRRAWLWVSDRVAD